MVHFDENTLYSMDELEEMLEGVVSLYVFLENIGLKKRGERIFRDAAFGWELLEAARRTKDAARESQEQELTEMINGLYFCMPLLLNITFGDPPYIERVDGSRIDTMLVYKYHNTLKRHRFSWRYVTTKQLVFQDKKNKNTIIWTKILWHSGGMF